MEPEEEDPQPAAGQSTASSSAGKLSLRFRHMQAMPLLESHDEAQLQGAAMICDVCTTL